jgi:hypothetical protein
MNQFSGRHYMNPAYGRAMSQTGSQSVAQADGDDGAESAQHDAGAHHGDLKHVTVHIQREGGFSVHAHYQHPTAGHHTVESKHASAQHAAERIQAHLRGHESRRTL